ncbi:MAG: putative serine protease, subtilase family [Candidatus Saccharibacteria bacterium]|nr:putative serine protease, subtilase family [Candidatus Saccharibacteria bacterium]
MRKTQKETTSHPNDRGGRRILRYVAVPVAVLIAVAGIVGLAPSASAWESGATASAACVGDKAVINGVFANNEASNDNSMDVAMHYGSLTDGPKTVAPGSSGSFTINTGQQSLSSGSVTFTMAWTNGAPGTDQVTANFNALSCAPPDDGDTKKIAFCHATGSATNPYVFIETSVNAFFQAGHIDHPNDIWPAFSYVKNGETINVPAQGDQSLLASGCVKAPEDTPVAPADVTFNDECGTTNDTYTVPTVVEGVQYIKDGQPVAAGTYPGTGTVTIVPQALPNYVLAPGTPTSWSHAFTNEDCTPPPSAGDYNGTTSGTCKVGTGTGYVDKGFGSSVTFTLKVGKKGEKKWATTSWTVAPGNNRAKSLPGSPADQVLLYAKGKLISASTLKKDCGNPPPPVCHNCNPTPPPPAAECVPPNNTWFDTNHNGVVDAGECVPTATAETGLADDISNRSPGLLEGSALMLVTLFGFGALTLLRRPGRLSLLKRR